MKKILIMLIVTVLFFSLFSFESEVSAATLPEIVEFANTVTDVNYVKTICTVEDGNPVMIGIHTGNPAKLNVINLNTMTVLRTLDVQFGNSFFALTRISNNDVYFAGYSSAHLYKYSVTTKELTDYGSLAGETAICQMTVDENDDIYMGTYPNGKVIKFNTSTEMMTDLGRIVPESDKYCKSLAYYNGYLYAGGYSPDTKLIEYNIESGTKKEIQLPADCSDIASINRAEIRGNRLFLYITSIGGNSYNYYKIYDLENKVWLDFKMISYVDDITEEYNGFVYLAVNTRFYKYRLSDDTYYATLMSPLIPGNPSISLLQTDDGLRMCHTNYSDDDIYVYNLDDETTKVFADVIPKVPTAISGIFASNDKLYSSPFMGGKGVETDLETSETTAEFSLGQTQKAFANIDGKIYFATYPTTDLVVFDPLQPVSSVNPKTLLKLSDENQGRPMNIAYADGKIVISTIGGYSYTNGSIVIYDIETGEYDKIKSGILEGHSICGLCEYNGYVYFTTTVTGGLGSSEITQECMIGRLNPSTCEIDITNWPGMDIGSMMKMCGDIEVGPDGKLWSVSDGLVFSISPDTLDVIDTIYCEEMIWRNTSRWEPYSLEFDSNGYLYANPNNRVYRINIESGSYQKIVPDSYGNIDVLTMSKNNVLYFIKNQGTMVYAMNFGNSSYDEYTKIYTPEDFMKIKDAPDGKYKLMNDIAIGSSETPFSEPFAFNGELISDDDNKYTITAYIKSSNTDGVGLFSKLGDGAVIKNIILEGNITNNGSSFTGGFAGVIDISATVTISDCINKAAVSGLNRVGGIIGSAYNCNDSTVISYSKNYGTITATNENAGGIAGLSDGRIIYCANLGKVTASYKAAGITGWSYSIINMCWNSGEISAVSRASGIVSKYSLTNPIQHCFNTGKIISTNSSSGYASGIVLYATNPIKMINVYNTGIIQSAVSDYSGPLTAANTLTIEGAQDITGENCWYLGNDDDNIVGTTAFTSAPSSLEEWALSDIYWEIVSDDDYCYPQIKNNRYVDDSNDEEIPPVQDGSDENPYLISSGSDFMKISEKPNKVFKLISDIELPIDYKPFAFSGELYCDKNDIHVISANISGSSAKTDSHGVGLFSCLDNGALLSNIILEGSVINNGDGYTGGFAGCISDQNANVTLKGLINKASVNGIYQTGGIIGRAVGSDESLITNCMNEGNITGSEDAQYTGGIAGCSMVLISDCENTGNVVSTDGNGEYAAGIVGWAQSTSIERCCNKGNVSADSYSAGIVSYMRKTNFNVLNCYNTGIIAGTSSSGIACYAYIKAKVLDCYNIGTADNPIIPSTALKRDITATNCRYLSQSESDEVDGTEYFHAAPVSLSEWEFDETIWKLNTENEYKYPTLK